MIPVLDIYTCKIGTRQKGNLSGQVGPDILLRIILSCLLFTLTAAPYLALSLQLIR